MQNTPSIRKNVGHADRAIRVTAGAALAIWPLFANRSPMAISALASLGGIQIHTGIVGY